MNNEYHIIGLMSGTSLDGLDIVKCRFQKHKNWSYKIEKCHTITYSNYWTSKLRNLHTKSGKDIAKANIEYGALLGNITSEYIQTHNLKCDYIASHGHTILHRPDLGYTLQIGDGATISNITNITTINNFRELDLSLGGQGAPLVPIGDLLLFPQYKYCLNLGGFSNISEKSKNGGIIAFDICPVNIVLNYLSKKKGRDFDDMGNIAKSGIIRGDLLKILNDIPFYRCSPPKSLGREWVEESIFPILKKHESSIKDKMRTFCEHIAVQISKNLQNDLVLITGGGAFNKYLISRINHWSNSKIIIPNKDLVNYKESLIFALLGILRIRNENNCLSSVTGAKKDCVGGDIFTKIRHSE